MNALPIVLNIIEAEEGPVAETYLQDLEEIVREYKETGITVRQNYIAGDSGLLWFAMRAYTCETRKFRRLRDALDWLVGGDEE